MELYSVNRAWHWLQALAERTAPQALPDGVPGDALGLLPALRKTCAAAFLEAVPSTGAGGRGTAHLIGGRIRGRTPGAPWHVAARYPAPHPSGGDGPATAEAPWRPNAQGSAPAVLLALAEALAAGPPLHDVVLLLFGAGADEDIPATAQAFADRPGLSTSGVIALGQVGGEGMTLDTDVRTLLHPLARALWSELFTLGRVLGFGPFHGGAEIAFPGLHVPFLAAGLPAVPLCDSKDLAAGSEDDRMEHCDPGALHAVGDVLCRFLRGERVV